MVGLARRSGSGSVRLVGSVVSSPSASDVRLLDVARHRLPDSLSLPRAGLFDDSCAGRFGAVRVPSVEPPSMTRMLSKPCSRYPDTTDSKDSPRERRQSTQTSSRSAIDSTSSTRRQINAGLTSVVALLAHVFPDLRAATAVFDVCQVLVFLGLGCRSHVTHSASNDFERTAKDIPGTPRDVYGYIRYDHAVELRDTEVKVDVFDLPFTNYEGVALPEEWVDSPTHAVSRKPADPKARVYGVLESLSDRGFTRTRPLQGSAEISQRHPRPGRRKPEAVIRIVRRGHGLLPRRLPRRVRAAVRTR